MRGRHAALDFIKVREIDRIMEGAPAKVAAHRLRISLKTCYRAFHRQGTYASYPKRKIRGFANETSP